jgi:hypothetical protein
MREAADEALVAQVNALTPTEQERLDEVSRRFGVAKYGAMLRALFDEEEQRKRDAAKRTRGGHRKVASSYHATQCACY